MAETVIYICGDVHVCYPSEPTCQCGKLVVIHTQALRIPHTFTMDASTTPCSLCGKLCTDPIHQA